MEINGKLCTSLFIENFRVLVLGCVWKVEIKKTSFSFSDVQLYFTSEVSGSSSSAREEIALCIERTQNYSKNPCSMEV